MQHAATNSRVFIWAILDIPMCYVISSVVVTSVEYVN